MKKHTFNFRDREQDFNRALKICRHELDTFLQSLTRPAVCQAAFFISAENQKNYSCMKNELSTEFADIVPVFSCAGQAPAEGRLAADMLICERFDPSTEIKVKRLNSHPYIRLQNKGITEIMVSGLCGDLNKSIENQSLSSYEKAKNILAAENMDFSHVYRQWN